MTVVQTGGVVLMATFKSCYHCKERYLGCHDKCNKYLKEKAEHEKHKEYAKTHQAVMLTNYDFDKITHVSPRLLKRRS